jgi:hypothetical protein
LTSLLVEGVENIGIKEATLRMKKGKFLFEDGELVFNNFSTPGKRIIMTASLKLDSGTRKPELNGNYRTRSLDMRDKTSYSGKIFLQKTEDTKGSSLLARLQLLKLASNKGDILAYGQRKEIKDFQQGMMKNLPSDKKTENAAKSDHEGKGISLSEKRNAAGKNNAENDNASTPDKSNVAATSTNVNKQTKIGLKNENKGSMVGEPENKSASIMQLAAEKVTSRKPLLIHEFSFSGDSLDLKFYDNGIVDGDTISVLLDDQIIISKEQLRTEAIERKLQIPAAKDSLLLTMYAENLGTYPPNTGILVIRDGKSRVEIRFMGDMENNPVIRLSRKK